MIDTSKIKLMASEKLLDDSTVMEIVEIVKEVGDFFEWNIAKTSIWMNTPNPMFGELIPMSLILLGRGHKVKQFIEAAREGNIE